MRVHGTGLTTAEAVEGRHFHGGRRASRDYDCGFLQLFKKES